MNHLTSLLGEPEKRGLVIRQQPQYFGVPNKRTRFFYSPKVPTGSGARTTSY